MAGARFQFQILLGFTVILAASGCGDNRTLVSVNVSPAVANAQSAPVQFTATGTFSKPPTPVVPLTGIVWCIGSTNGTCNGNINSGATVDGNGLATCAPGFSGTVNVLAGKPATMMSPVPDGSTPLKVFGAASLSCP